MGFDVWSVFVCMFVCGYVHYNSIKAYGKKTEIRRFSEMCQIIEIHSQASS